MHSVIKLSPKAYGCQTELVKFDVPCVSTHRPKPEVAGLLEKRLVIFKKVDLPRYFFTLLNLILRADVILIMLLQSTYLKCSSPGS